MVRMKTDDNGDQDDDDDDDDDDNDEHPCIELHETMLSTAK